MAFARRWLDRVTAMQAIFKSVCVCVWVCIYDHTIVRAESERSIIFTSSRKQNKRNISIFTLKVVRNSIFFLSLYISLSSYFFVCLFALFCRSVTFTKQKRSAERSKYTSIKKRTVIEKLFYWIAKSVIWLRIFFFFNAQRKE